MVTFRLYAKVWDSSPKDSRAAKQKPDSTDRKQAHYISDDPVQSATGYYNEQGNWVAEPPRPSPLIQTAHLVSLKQKVPATQDIQDIHLEIDPDTSLTQGMTQSQNSFRKTSKTFNSSKKQVSPCSGTFLHANAMEVQPIWQNLTKSSSSFILQVSQQSPRDQDIQESPDVSVQSFCDTETDPETYSKVNSIISKKVLSFLFQRCPRIFPKKGSNSPKASNQRNSIPAILQTTQC